MMIVEIFNNEGALLCEWRGGEGMGWKGLSLLLLLLE